MEDGLVLNKFNGQSTMRDVLILVVMEDGLVPLALYSYMHLLLS